jgi:hypothetical protein
MLPENIKIHTMAAQNTYSYDKVMSQCAGGTCLSSVNQTVHCEIWYSDGVVSWDSGRLACDAMTLDGCLMTFLLITVASSSAVK